MRYYQLPIEDRHRWQRLLNNGAISAPGEAYQIGGTQIQQCLDGLLQFTHRSSLLPGACCVCFFTHILPMADPLIPHQHCNILNFAALSSYLSAGNVVLVRHSRTAKEAGLWIKHFLIV